MLEGVMLDPVSELRVLGFRFNMYNNASSHVGY